VSEAARFIRDFGRKVIQERQEAVLRGDDTPQDILAHILRVAEEDPSLTLEDLVDEFVTFFVAGQVAEEFVTLFGVLQVMLSHFTCGFYLLLAISLFFRMMWLS